MSSNLVKNIQLPKGWLPTIIGDLLDFEYGKGLTKQKRNENGKFPVYGSNGIVGYHTDFLVKAPALIIGRKGAAGEVSYSDKNCWPIDTTYFINKLKHLNIKFVFYVLKSLRLNQYDRSTAIPGLNRNDAYELSFNFPPLPEQHQIVAKIEELFSELDNGIENLKKAREQLKTYRQAVLKYAFEGKLTKEWRSLQRRAGNPPEPAEKLLEQIKTEREKHYLKQCQIAQNNGERRPKKLDTSYIEKNKPSFDLPSKWVWCRITDLFNELTDYHANGSYKKLKEKVELYDEPNYALMVRATNFEKKDFTNSCKYISNEAYRFLSKSKLLGGEVLIGKIGNAGKVYYMPQLNRPASLAMNLFALRFVSGVVSKYIYYHLIAPFSEKDIFSYVKGVGNITIDKKSVRSLLIALPLLKEQHAIVQEIESRLSVCDKIEQTIEDSLKKAEALRQSILKKAFAGELTKDWREKHPELITGKNSAEKLLEKIKAEKTLTAGRKKPQSKKTKKSSPKQKYYATKDKKIR